LLNAPYPSPENKNPANFSEAYKQEFLTPPQILADLIKNLWYEPREVRSTEGTSTTGAELEIFKAQKKAALERLLSEHFLKTVHAGNPGDVFQAVQEKLEPKFRGYKRLSMEVYLELRRSGVKDITIQLFREAVFAECSRLNLPKPTHLRRDVLLPCGLGHLGKARPGPRTAKGKPN
jgi:hypothetical protein